MKDGGLGKLFPKYLPHFHWQTIELSFSMRGIPDKNYCFDGKEGWLEFKNTNGRSVPLRPEQIGWLMRRVRHGGRAFIAVRQKKNDTLWLIPGADAEQAKHLGLTNQKWLHWYNGPRSWDWKAIENVITN